MVISMKNLSKFNIIEYVEGAVFLLLGILTFVKPNIMLTGIVIIYGIIAVATGILDIVAYIKIERFTGFGPVIALIAGIMSVMCGATLMIYPNIGRTVFAFLFAIWFITHCVSKLAHIDILRLANNKFIYYFSLVINIVGIFLGFAMMFSPSFSMQAMNVFIGVYLILLGIESIAAAYITGRYYDGF